MVKKTISQQAWVLASYLLDDAYTDFILSRQAMLCSPGTLRFYKFTAGKFVEWLKSNSINSPEDIASRHVRSYLAELNAKGLSDSYINGHARAIRTLLRFLHSENYISHLITFKMPPIAKKRLLVLSVDELKKVIQACLSPRDKAIVLLLADSGIRRAELCALNWSDVDIKTGIVRIERGKGGKSRTVVMGVNTRRALLAYRRTINNNSNSALFQTKNESRLTPRGLRSALLRVGERAGVKVTPHALRRTFATLSLRAGMNILQLQALLGHSSLDMTRQYIELLDEDLLEAHKEHGPIDMFIKK